jgi:hypothetical protein
VGENKANHRRQSKKKKRRIPLFSLMGVMIFFFFFSFSFLFLCVGSVGSEIGSWAAESKAHHEQEPSKGSSNRVLNVKSNQVTSKHRVGLFFEKKPVRKQAHTHVLRFLCQTVKIWTLITLKITPAMPAKMIGATCPKTINTRKSCDVLSPIGKKVSQKNAKTEETIARQLATIATAVPESQTHNTPQAPDAGVEGHKR